MTGLALAISATGCSGSAKPETAASVLDKARSSLDNAVAVHFTLTSDKVPPGGTKLIGASGFAVRPRAFTGDLDMLVNGSKVSLKMISVGGKVYIKAPFSEKFSITNPADFGLRDPGYLVEQKTGVVQLVTAMYETKLTGQSRVNGEVVDNVSGLVPGQVVKDLLTSAKPEVPVKIQASVAHDKGELRQAVLTGPFFKDAPESVFTIVFDQYGAQVSVEPPPVG